MKKKKKMRKKNKQRFLNYLYHIIKFMVMIFWCDGDDGLWLCSVFLWCEDGKEERLTE